MKDCFVVDVEEGDAILPKRLESMLIVGEATVDATIITIIGITILSKINKLKAYCIHLLVE